MDLNKIGRGILGNALARLYKLDDMNAVGTMAPEIMPVVSIWERPEFWALVGGSFGVARVAMTGGVGTTQKSRLVNPAGSGSLVIVELLTPNTASTIYYGLQQASVGTYVLSSVAHRDSRRVWAGATQTGLAAKLEILSTGGTSGIADGKCVSEELYPLNYILSPGWALHVQASDETDLDYTILWRERAAGLDELSVL